MSWRAIINTYNGCKTRHELKEFLSDEALNYPTMSSGLKKRLFYIFASNPGSDQYYIWKYIKCLRRSEYYYFNSVIFDKPSLISLFRSIRYIIKINTLKKLSYKLGYQIPPGVFGKGLQIYHYGSIIVNQNARVGNNATIYAGVVIGEKNGKCPVIGDNCFIGAGSKVLGGVKIGNNVTIAPNAVVIHDIPDNVVVGGVPAKILKKK